MRRKGCFWVSQELVNDTSSVLLLILSEIRFEGKTLMQHQRFDDREDVLFFGTSPWFMPWDGSGFLGDGNEHLPQYHIILHTGEEMVTGLKSTWVQSVEPYKDNEGLILTDKHKEMIK